MASLISQGQTQTSADGFEDSMEISSDHGRQVDDDIDIDIDVPAEDPQVTNDDYMVDENAAAAQDDDVMFDEDRSADVIEEQMHDNIQDYYDEELVDINTEQGALIEESFLPESLEDETLQPPENDFLNSQDLAEEQAGKDEAAELYSHVPQGNQPQVDDDYIEKGSGEDDFSSETHEPQDASYEAYDDVAAEQLANNGHHSNEASIRGVDFALEDPNLPGDNPLAQHNDRSGPIEPHSASFETTELRQPIATLKERDPAAGSVGDEDEISNKSKASIDLPETTALATDSTSSKEQNGAHLFVGAEEPDLHPVIVHWEEEEVPLFGSDDMSEFFLGDSSIAASQFIDLFAAFKEVLRDDYSEQFTLSIEFVEMGLYVEEHEAEALGTTLADVINLYLQLKLNDGIHNPGPLHLNLTSRESAEARLTFLLDNAAEGVGMSQVSVVDPSSGETGIEDISQEHATEDQLADDRSQKEPLITEYQPSAIDPYDDQQLQESFEHEAVNTVLNETTDHEYAASGDGPIIEQPSPACSTSAEDDELEEDNFQEETFNEDDFLDGNDVDNRLAEGDIAVESYEELSNAGKDELNLNKDTSHDSSRSSTIQGDAEQSYSTHQQTEIETHISNDGFEAHHKAPSNPERETWETIGPDQEINWEEQETQSAKFHISTFDGLHSNDDEAGDLGSPLQDFEDTPAGKYAESTNTNTVNVNEGVVELSQFDDLSQNGTFPAYDESVLYPRSNFQPTAQTVDAIEAFDSDLIYDKEQQPLETNIEWPDLDTNAEPHVGDSSSTIHGHEESHDTDAPTAGTHTNVLDSPKVTRKRSLSEVEDSENQPDQTDDVKRPRPG